jgi:pimeloyl-ACP methyl ester carboxylesterase
MNTSGHDTAVTVATRLGALRVRTLGSGAPAVLWHSLFADSASWDRVRDLLAPQRRLILIDGPCHGGSAPVRTRFTLQDCAGAAQDVLDRLGVFEPVDWIGNAWGGHVGIVFAATRARRTRSLVTIGTPVRALTRAERLRIVPLAVLYRLLGPVRPLVAGVEDALLGAGAPAQDTQVISAALRRADRRGMYAAMRSVMLRRPSLLPLLPALLAPTLFVGIIDDAYSSQQETREMAGLLPRGACTILPGSGHVAPLLQQAPALADVLTGFWHDPGNFGTRHIQADPDRAAHHPQ